MTPNPEPITTECVERPADPDDAVHTADRLLDQAVRAALEDERPRAVAAWLRRVATSVERGDYEE